jgi:hypothetical protein
MVSRTIDAAFVERVRRGEYDMDAHSVAEAMIRRWRRPGGLASGEGAALRSLVLVATEPFDDPAIGSEEGKAETGGYLAYPGDLRSRLGRLTAVRSDGEE